MLTEEAAVGTLSRRVESKITAIPARVTPELQSILSFLYLRSPYFHEGQLPHLPLSGKRKGEMA